ncbi:MULTISPECIES: TRAP transporter substrate-binding protein [Salipiger]|uniref:TRAP-type C4-dicarboxylate transport system n=1 Tax=Salipiger bermudensis (strain DSM 26914 / JCM 13377 / KCTC 12554 / HTCC2601) TaxID=314265 RepID=Q0FH52_SALBH|nr:DctP family TRAP transporter solute-binding subunit [Salipiger bermudensis]EAU43521.1 TRAP-type C4-dicarboxylate transport system [Salipiger bermudensis HTCC2601]MAE89435.1 C4-dicarboxylate ABC transporter substrate-binding protein [Pelagibaca sp.]MBN9677729.1 DctP family TRAP transporter solute-binding subunit [Salipiger bermudensis]MCA1286998.1 DctP family TRAP transporter solute-binding subunit [Salipiger bermudensis]
MKFLATTAIAALMATGAMAQDVTIRLAHLNPEDPFASHSGAMGAVFKSLVESNSNGRIEVQLFPNGQLGKDNEVIEQVRSGLVESTISSSGGMAQHYPLVGVFDIPFAFPNIGVASKVIDTDSSFGEAFVADLEEKTGLEVLGLLDSGGFFAFTDSVRPIASVEDMDGLKIRTMTLPTHEAMISSLGGQPTPLPWAEVYTALQTGVADGQMNPVPIIAFAKFDEVQQYLSITNHLITPYIWTMNAEFLGSLSEEDQYLVKWAADVATDAGRSMSRVIEASEKGLPALAAKMEVNVVTPEEQAKFAEAAQPAVRALIEENYGAEGTAMLEAMLSSIEEEKTDF